MRLAGWIQACSPAPDVVAATGGLAFMKPAPAAVRQIKYPHHRFYRLAPIRDELSPQTAAGFDKIALFDELRREDTSQATALKAVGWSRATLYR